MNIKIEAGVHVLLVLIAAYILYYCMPTMLPVYKGIFIYGMAGVLLMDLYLISAGKLSLMKFCRTALMYLLALLLIVFITFYLTKVLVLTDAYGLESVLREYNSAGKILFFTICFLQPILLPLPEAITIPAGSAVFGPASAALIGFAGTISGITAMFWFARISGIKVISRFIKEHHLETYQKYVGKNETLLLLMLFVIPVLPDEIICVGAGIGGVSFRKFLSIAAISKLATSLLLAYSVYLAKLLSLSGSQVILVCSLLIGAGLFISFIIKRRGNKSAEM